MAREPTSVSRSEIKSLVKETLAKDHEFLVFLKENKLLGKYIKYVVNSTLIFDYYQKEKYLSLAVSKVKSRMNGFSWGRTNEGFDFWNKKDYECYIQLKNSNQ